MAAFPPSHMTTATATISVGPYITGSDWDVRASYFIYIRASPTASFDAAADVIKNAVADRKSLFRKWNREALSWLVRLKFNRQPFPGRPLDRLVYLAERRELPIRKVYSRRVCGGHQRYRVMTK